MIIDAHVHIGDVVKFNMSKEMVLKSMEKYNIDFSLFSNIEGVEYDCEQVEIDKEFQKSQKEINEVAISFARENPDKLGVLLWTKPTTEGVNKDFEDLIINNRDVVYGIKVHPFHSKIAFDNPKVEEYIKLAEKYDLPVLTHTAKDDESHVDRVYNMALKYPNVTFVMGHMGLESDNKRAMELMNKLPNLYGDTAWVRPENIIGLVQKYGADKIIFGSDNPIDGLETYAHKEFYDIYFNKLKDAIGEEEYNKIMYKNPMKVYKCK